MQNPISQKFLCSLGVAGLALAAFSTAHAQTTFNDASPTNTQIQNPGNWSNGLPTSSNLGTIAIDATYVAGSSGNMDGYFMTLTNGTLSRAAGSATFNILNGSFTVDGAGANFVYSGIGLTNATYTIDSGTGSQGGTTVRATRLTNSTATFNGGSSTFGREIVISGSGQFIVNGGTVTISEGGDLAQSGFKSSGVGGVGFIFNGGTTVAPIFDLTDARTVQFGGTTAGSLTLAGSSFTAGSTPADYLGSNITLDFLTGSLMTFTVAGADEAFYQGLWSSTVLQYNGGNVGAFSDFFTVSGATLSLVPEASAFALIFGGAALGFVALRRRR